MRYGLRSNARTRIFHPNDDVCTLACHRNAHLSVWGRELKCVRQQVVHHLINILWHEVGNDTLVTREV